MYVKELLIGLVCVINLLAFFVIMYDKRKSRHGGGTGRTAEGLMFLLAAMLGGIGVYAGMLIFRHKTRRWYFQLAMPLLILQNMATVYLSYLLLPVL